MKSPWLFTTNIDSKEMFVNVYRDDEGRFISDSEYSSYSAAFENRDKLSTYVETIKITRI